MFTIFSLLLISIISLIFFGILIGAVIIYIRKNKDQINEIADKLTTEAGRAGKKAGDAAAPMFEDMSGQVKNAWSEMKTEEGKKDIKAMIQKDRNLFIAPLISCIFAPIYYRIALAALSLSAIFTSFFWLQTISMGVTLGIFVFVMIARDIKFQMIYQVPYMLGYGLLHLSLSHEYGLITLLIQLFGFPIIWAALYFAKKYLNKEEIKPLVLDAVAIFLWYFLIQATSYSIYSWYLSAGMLWGILITVATTWYLFKKNYHISIFQFNKK
jgi:hypothetical protein